ncbi:MAG: hypothetical protein IRY95_00245 [Clostridia bacterium]|nr:hypothetical protein [Clostridia bacterium]
MSRQVDCRAVFMDAVCSWGRACFHNTHFLYEDVEGRNIPEDACPINCAVNRLEVEEGFRQEDEVVLRGSYRVSVWFETGVNTETEVRLAQATFSFDLRIPVQDIAGGCVTCNGKPPEVCWINPVLHCLSAEVEETPRRLQRRGFPKYRLRVRVEKEFLVIERGESIVCIPTCPEPAPEVCPPIPAVVAPAVCEPYEEEPICPPEEVEEREEEEEEHRRKKRRRRRHRWYYDEDDDEYESYAAKDEEGKGDRSDDGQSED